MNKIKQIIGNLFGSPVQNMSFVAYMNYVNTAGKITAKSLLDLVTICLTVIDEMEKKHELHEENFRQIQSILGKLVDEKTTPILPMSGVAQIVDPKKSLDTKEFEKPTPIASIAPPTVDNMPPKKAVTKTK